MKTLSDVTLYDLMGDDHTVWLKENEKFGFDLEIENYEGETIIQEKGITPAAAESFAHLCRRFIYIYDKIQDRLSDELDEKITGGDQ